MLLQFTLAIYWLPVILYTAVTALFGNMIGKGYAVKVTSWK